MKKTKSLTSLVAFAIIFACVLSCNDQEEQRAGILDLKRNDNANFNGTEGDPLDLSTAKRWTANFRRESNNPDEILAHYFGSEIIEQILNQSNCVGVRIYYALDDKGEKKLLLVGVDSKGENLTPVAGAKVSDGDGGTIADYSWPCPDYCPGGGL